MRFVPLTPELLRMVPWRADQMYFAATVEKSRATAVLTIPEMAWAALEGGYVLGAFGVIAIEGAACSSAGRGQMWLVPGLFARPRHIVAALPFADAWLARLLSSHFRRLEASVAADFAQGCTLLERLRFVRETAVPMRRYGIDGADHHLYARVAS